MSSIPASLEQYYKPIVAELRSAITTSGHGLYQMIPYHMGWTDVHGHSTHLPSGKALRPALCLFACHLVGGKWHDALPAAAALELIHNFSLIHDDIQDGDTERRHRPTLWVLWGKPKALQAGNAMCCIADRMLLQVADHGVSPTVTLELSSNLTNRYMEMIEGQYLDLRFEDRLDVTVSQYLDMASKKTGALIECAMFIGSLLATQNHQIAHAVGRCGRLLGLAFQIRDDILGIWGNPDVTGKPTGTDIYRRKKSLPIVYTLEQATENDRTNLITIYQQNSVSKQDAQTVLDIMEHYDARNHAQSIAENKCQEAIHTLDHLHVATSEKTDLETIASYIVQRDQ